ncbi:MAG: PIN domain-containing protein [Deltaproteobacteria bacterium]|nr:PIN domain-containing protein [Deltaproteobacteria bacterium]
MKIFLDTGVLGQLVHVNEAMKESVVDWAITMLERGEELIVPEIADYELRRALLKIDSVQSLKDLDQWNKTVTYLPIRTTHMHKAAELWAQCRKENRPFAKDAALDGDVILIAQTLEYAGAVIATTNVGHLSQLADARQWSDIN